MVGKVLSRTVALIRDRWQGLAGAAIAFGALSELIGLLFQVFNQDALNDLQSAETIDPETLDVGQIFGGLFVWSVLAMVVGLVITAVMLNMVAEADRSGVPDVNVALSKSFSRFLPLLGLVLLSTISIMVGFLLLVAPGIWIAVSLVPAVAIFFLEDKGPLDSFKESIRLVRGSWWPVLGIILSVGLFVFLLGFFRLVPGPIGFLLGVVVAAVTVVVQAAAIYFTFVELRGVSTIEDVRTT
ncbi:MAG: hypothetical protein BMS9Abin17_0591 [Acidimicrobiia bacterium]|nr:MAG: hypothetical protein BMS9Abin17_0591 [Acidimicrobiia bacterium]